MLLRRLKRAPAVFHTEFIFHLALAAFCPGGSNQSNLPRRGARPKPCAEAFCACFRLRHAGNEWRLYMSTKQDDANLILKLYELRREEVMRKARDWFIWFNPASMQDILDTFMSDKSAYYRMVTSYWEMAATLVNHGAIDEEMFNEANGEQTVVFAKIEPFLAELRTKFDSPQMLANLEKLVMRKPNAKELLVALRERFKQMAAMRAEAASKAQAG
jgi:hypothetical protein